MFASYLSDGPIIRCLLGASVVLAGWATASAQSPPAPSRSVDPSPSAAQQIAAPFESLAAALADTGRSEAAEAVRHWVPLHREDSRLVYFSQIQLEIPSPALNEPKVRAAFLRARQQAAEIARQSAVERATQGDAEGALADLWRALRENPDAPDVRAQLGLSPGNTAHVTIRPGRDAPAALSWPDRSFLIAQSAHFRIYSTASRRATAEMAEDLERFFEVWSQVFHGFWSSDEQLCERIARGQPLEVPSTRVEVVLFGSREAYVRALSENAAAAEQSTGFYAPEARLTLLFDGPEADPETRYHEITHQLLQECGGTGSGFDVVDRPGALAGFWVVEGIASYMESVRFFPSYAAVGGWESPRLQFARARWLVARNPPSLETLAHESQQAVQQREDLGGWYSTTAAYVHMMADNSRLRTPLMNHLRSVYRGQPAWDPLHGAVGEEGWSEALCRFLALRDQPLGRLRPGTELRVLCLGRTEVQPAHIGALLPQPNLIWLDLAGLPVSDAIVERLTAGGDRVERLNLESTAVTDDLRGWLGRQRRLQEIDLSFTPVGDPGIAALDSLRGVSVLWLTGSRISDASLPVLLSLRSLEALDVQRTGISAQALDQFRASRPDCLLNPLQLIPLSPTPHQP